MKGNLESFWMDYLWAFFPGLLARIGEDAGRIGSPAPGAGAQG